MSVAVDVSLRGGVPLLRTSERGDFKRCPWLWSVVWEQGLTTRRVPTWSWFGTAIHKGLEARYPVGNKRGSKADTIDAFVAALDGEVRRVYTEGGELDDQEVVDGKALGIAMLEGYIRHFGKDSEWQVIHTEQPFQIDVVDPDTGELLVIYAGTWDALMLHKPTGEFWIWDHKTRKSFPSNWNFYNINDQAGSYLWVAPEILRFMGIFKKKDKIEGLIFNALKKSMPDTRPRNAQGLATNKPTKQHYIDTFTARDVNVPPRATLAVLAAQAEEMGITVFGDVSATQPAELFHRERIWRSPQERVTQGQRVIAEAKAMTAMRNGTLPIWKTPTEDCIRCPIFEYCELHEQSPEDAPAFRDSVLKRRDPYRDHRENFADKGVSLTVEAAPKGKKKKGH